jgi:hypothetical protein
MGEELIGGGVRLLPRRDEIIPLTATLRRVHFNVDRQVVKKLKAAREGLSNALPGATMEQVLEAALDLLLEKQARARGLVKRPRTTITGTAPPLALLPAEPTPTTPASTERPPASSPTTAPLPPRREGPRETIPAAVRRAVWARDQGRCCWPLDGGGVCGSTHRLELDHVIPWAEWGPSTEENLRVVCGRHNALAARQVFGERLVERYSGRRADGAG